MLTQKQIKEIREYLDNSQNPVFFFDNDVDGLCSFLILQRYCEKGKGVAIRSFPDLSLEYFKKVNELNGDCIFVLDKHAISKEFFDEAEKVNIPIIWIDHHNVDMEIPKFVHRYNPHINNSEIIPPTTYLCYQVSQKKDDLWLAALGSISDGFVPEFYSEIKEKYSDLTIASDNAFEIRYGSKFGNIIQIFSFALKDRVVNVINMLKFLMKIKTPYEVLNESGENYTMHQRFNEINSKYKRLIEKAENFMNEKNILFFKYSGDLSISSDIANGLYYKFPNKIIIVAFVSGIKVNISARGKNIKEIILKSIKGLEDSTGGGHEEAVGAKIKTEDIDEFKKRIENIVSTH